MTDAPEKEIHMACQFFIYLSYGMLVVVGRIRDLIDLLHARIYTNNSKTNKQSGKQSGVAPLILSSESFYRRRLYARAIDCFNRPIRGPASDNMIVVNRDRSTLKHLQDIKCLNLASYNYLGFVTPGHCVCEPNVLSALNKYGVSTCSSAYNCGTTVIHKELEEYVSKFLNVQDCMVFGMGWGTNATAIPALVGKGCLIISDSINHNSIITGARNSGAKVKTFKHNDIDMLEKVIRRAIIDGQPRTHRSWKKILIIVEGMCCIFHNVV